MRRVALVIAVAIGCGRVGFGLRVSGSATMVSIPIAEHSGDLIVAAMAPADASNTVTLAQSVGTHPLGLFLLAYSGIAATPLEVSSEVVAPSPSNAM